VNYFPSCYINNDGTLTFDRFPGSSVIFKQKSQKKDFVQGQVTFQEEARWVWIQRKGLIDLFTRQPNSLSLLPCFPELHYDLLHNKITEICNSTMDPSLLKKMVQAAQPLVFSSYWQMLPIETTGCSRTIIVGFSQSYILFTSSQKKDPLIGKGMLKRIYNALGILDAKRYVVMILDENSYECEQLEACLDCPQIVRKQGDLIDNKMHYIICEYCNRGDLSKVFKTTKLSFRDKLKIAMDLLKGLFYLHRNNRVHQDLKPENIFIHEEGGQISAKIGDLGSTVCFTDPEDLRKEQRGSWAYIPPERIPGIKNNNVWLESQNPSSDMWSTGLLLYELFHPKHNKIAFQNAHDLCNAIEGLYAHQLTREIEHQGIPWQIQLLISQMLQVDPQKRITAEEALIALEKIDLPPDQEAVL